MTGMDLSQSATRREMILFGLVLLTVVVLFMRVVLSIPAGKIEMAGSKREALSLEKDALVKFTASTPAIQKSPLSKKKGIKTKILTGEIRSNYQSLPDLLERVTEPIFLGGVTIDKISHKPPVQDRGFSKADFTLQVRGSFSHVMRYLDQLEQFPALFHLEQLEVKTAEGQAQDVSAEIVGRFIALGGMPAATPAVSDAGQTRGGGKQ